MQKTFTLILIVGMFFIAGCSHNIVTYSDGIALETTFRPDSGNFGFILRYGKILNVTARENTEVEMLGAGGGDGNTGTTATSANVSGNVKVKIGKQITGYYVDALEAGASAKDLDKYTVVK